MPTTTRASAFSALRTATRSLEGFSLLAAPRTLRPYQLEIGNAIIRSVLNREGKTFVVMMARQAGKNELSAQLEAYLLHLLRDRGGSIVKAAPSYRPQLRTSRDRIEEMMGAWPFAGWTARDHVITHGNARLLFFSADPAANVVGATASLLLEIDEAQDVDEDVYEKCFRPMGSTRRVTTVLYGTRWNDDTILEIALRHNETIERKTGERLNFIIPWTVPAEYNHDYKCHVEAEIARRGLADPVIKTQYLQQVVPDAGRLFPASLIAAFCGSHDLETEPSPDAAYVAGIDVAGEVSDPELDGKRLLSDTAETVITILRIDRDGPANHQLPRIVHIERIVGMSHALQLEVVPDFLRRWSPRRIAIDATGVGRVLASCLLKAFPTRLDPFVFTAESKSKLGFDLRSAIETRRLSLYAQSTAESLELVNQLQKTRYALHSEQRLSFEVPAHRGHDDCVMSLALAVHATASCPPPSFGGMIRGRDPDVAAGMERHFWGRPGDSW